MIVEYYTSSDDYTTSYDLIEADTGDSLEKIVKMVASDYWGDKCENGELWPITFQIFINNKSIGYFKIMLKVDFEIIKE